LRRPQMHCGRRVCDLSRCRRLGNGA
jgi:hypothetical protein